MISRSFLITTHVFIVFWFGWVPLVQVAKADDSVQPLFLNKTSIEFIAPARLPFENPLTSSDANSMYYSLLPRLGGMIAEKVTTKYPVLSNHMGLRFLEWSTFFVGTVPWMVLSHEEGHYRIEEQYGESPEIQFDGWSSAFVMRRNPLPNIPKNFEKFQLMFAAGVNQGQLNALFMYQDWVRNTNARYQEALAYMLTKTNLMLYAAKTAALTPLSNNGIVADDIDAYLRLAQLRKHPLSMEHVLIPSIVTTVLSANTIAALVGQVQFVIDGKRRVQTVGITWKDWNFFAPEFYTLLSTNGVFMGGFFMVRTPLRFSIGLETDVRLDGKVGALGLHGYDFPITRWWRFSPFVRMSILEDHSLGIATGTEAIMNLFGPISIVGKLEFQSRDFLSEMTGKKEGTQGILSIGFH